MASIPLDVMGDPAQNQGNMRDVVIEIDGMTCMSCVRNIEGHIGDKEGVISIKVSLEGKEGHVQYNPEITTAEDIRGAIYDMGFEAKLKESSDQKSTNTKHKSLDKLKITDIFSQTSYFYVKSSFH